MKKELDQVTICAIDTLNPHLASVALEKSCCECRFGESILFTDTRDFNSKNFKLQSIKKINSKNDYSRFVLKDLSSYIRTNYVLIIQWDGYVISGSKWNDAFLGCDYIGAPWHWFKDGLNVGNGGFSLRSKKLLEILTSDAYPFIDNLNEDEQICRAYRKKLESEHSIRFASDELAHSFSYERTAPDMLTFGFHGLFNMWRHLNDSEIIDLVSKLSPKCILTIEFFELLIQYYSQKKFKALNNIYKLVTKSYTDIQIEGFLKTLISNVEFVSNFIKACKDE
jgi:Protein of unknown function (DUF5672)